MQFSTKCWSEHILSAYKATKDLKHPLYMTFKRNIRCCMTRNIIYKSASTVSWIFISPIYGRMVR